MSLALLEVQGSLKEKPHKSHSIEVQNTASNSISNKRYILKISIKEKVAGKVASYFSTELETIIDDKK